MTITIRVQSPFLRRYMVRQRIEKLPPFPMVRQARFSSPLMVWFTTIALVFSAFSLVMAASIDIPVAGSLKQVGTALVDQIRRDTRTESSFIQTEPFPLGTPPLQSMDSPRMRPSVAVGSLDGSDAAPRKECTVGHSTVACN